MSLSQHLYNADALSQAEHAEIMQEDERPRRIKTTDPNQVRQHIATLGEHRGGCGTQCDYHADWSEQSYARGSVRTVKPHRGKPYWLLFTS